MLGTGVAPNSQLAADAGVETGVKGAIRVNPRQQTGSDGIWAAGDCAESHHPVSRLPVHIPLGTVANRQARAGINLGGGYGRSPVWSAPAYVTELCATEVARTGLSEREAVAAGLEYVVGKIKATTWAGQPAEARPIVVKMLAERGWGRILGAQLVGEEGAGKRIDAVAVALTAGFSVEDLLNTDLAYAPPFSPAVGPRPGGGPQGPRRSRVGRGGAPGPRPRGAPGRRDDRRP